MTTNKKPEQPCPICKNPKILYASSTSDYITGEIFDIYKCQSCGVSTTFPLLTNEGIEKYYRQTYYGKRKSFVDSLVNLLRRLSNGLDIKVRKSVLDIGCGTGSFLRGLKDRGWEIHGTEFAPQTYLDPEVYPHVRQQPINKCGYPDQSFDVITMWHILEHVDDPVLYLNEANRLLKTAGVLLVEVPNIESWQANITGNNWFNIELPRHRFHFSPQSLSALLVKSDFDKIEISYANFIYNIYGSVQSFLNIASRRKNLMFDLLNGKMTRSEITKNKLDVALVIVGVIPLSIISTALCCGEILFRRGGIMLIKASKK